jgi:hypothetical protein
MTKADSAMAASDKDRKKRLFEYRLDAFLKQYRPDDPHLAHRFECELILLVREVYADAQEPLLKAICGTALLTQPLQHIVGDGE